MYFFYVIRRDKNLRADSKNSQFAGQLIGDIGSLIMKQFVTPRRGPMAGWFQM